MFKIGVTVVPAHQVVGLLSDTDPGESHTVRLLSAEAVLGDSGLASLTWHIGGEADLKARNLDNAVAFNTGEAFEIDYFPHLRGQIFAFVNAPGVDVLNVSVKVRYAVWSN